VFVVLIAVRVLSLVTAQLTTSFIPWDTSMHWATKSLVWFEHRQIVPFVEQAQWLERMSADVYTDHHPLYPRTIPLVQTWMALANNRWDYTIVGLPWTCWLIATGLLLFGQLRQRGLNTLSATVFVYLLLSLPLLNTHAVLTGYADLLSGALYGGCVMAFYGWCLDRQTWQLNTCVIAGLMCLTIKNEGLFWAATLIPGFLWVALPERLRIRTLTLGVCFVVATIIFIPKDLSVAGHTLQELNLHFRPAAIAGLIRSWYQLDNWHLLLWLISALICALIIVPAEKRQALAPLLVVVLSALILFIFLFTFTQYAWGAVRQTAVGRLNLHLIPALTFLAAMLWQPVIASLAQRASQGMPPPIAN
jgi:NADH:ubiquinone oxidoreductase subunit 6 (subunit J)